MSGSDAVTRGRGARERIEQLVTSTPRGGPAVVGTVGIGLFLATLLNFFGELQQFGFGWPQVAAVLLGAWLSAVVVYGALYLHDSEYTPRQRWQVAAASLAGVGFVYLVMYVTVFVRPSVGLRIGGPTLQLLASAHAGAVAGYLIGLLYVTARNDARQARQVGQQLEFMHSILRHDVLNSMMVVRADDMLPAVFGNLLSNAVQHNDADDPRINVTVRAGAESVEVRIADNGPGIDDAEKEAIFEQGHSSSGGGFGLFFVRTMLDHYGGSIHVEDNQPRGSVFVVSLPRAEAERPTATAAGVET